MHQAAPWRNHVLIVNFDPSKLTVGALQRTFPATLRDRWGVAGLRGSPSHGLPAWRDCEPDVSQRISLLALAARDYHPRPWAPGHSAARRPDNELRPSMAFKAQDSL